MIQSSRRLRLCFACISLLLVFSAAAIKAETSQAMQPKGFDLTLQIDKEAWEDLKGRGYGQFVEEALTKFSEVVFEQTNGAHYIKSVKCWVASQIDKPDIHWQIMGRANAAPKKVIRVFGRSEGSDKNCKAVQGDEIDATKLGLILGHEWGHYKYALFDEYIETTSTCKTKLSKELYMPQPDDVAIRETVMSCDMWGYKIESVTPRYDTWNFSTAEHYLKDSMRIDYKKTAQGRFWGGSCWDILKQKHRFVTYYYKANWNHVPGSKIGEFYFSELAAVAPAKGEKFRVELDTRKPPATSVVWMSGNKNLCLILDVSGSMANPGANGMTRLQNAVAAAKALLDYIPQSDFGKVWVSVVAFSDTAVIKYPRTVVSSFADKAAIKASLDTLIAGGGTQMSSGLGKGLEALAPDANGGDQSVAFLLSDGQPQDNPKPILSSYKDKLVRIHTFAYGSEADLPLMKLIAGETGGFCFESPTSSQQLADAFKKAYIIETFMQKVRRLLVTLNAAPPHPAPVPVNDMTSTGWTIEAGVADMEVLASYSVSAGADHLRLRSPNGVLFAQDSSFISSSDTVCVWSVSNPDPGEWRIVSVGGPPSLEVLVEVFVKADETGLVVLNAACMPSNVVTYPQLAVLHASVSRSLPVAGVRVDAVVETPDGQTWNLPLLDDGVDPDAVADDGNYVAHLPYAANGTYKVLVMASNPDQTARETYNGLLLAPNPDGNGGVPEDVPLGFDFERMEDFEVSVSNVRADDHGNTPVAATNAQNDDSDTPGRIEYDGDVDVFRVSAPADAKVLVFRITSLAMGMDPAVTILGGPNGSQIRATADISTHKSKTGYLVVSVSASPGEVFYCAVQHRDPAGRGFYLFSAGSELLGEEVSADVAVSLTNTPATGILGRPLTFTATVRNLGPATATEVINTLSFSDNVEVQAVDCGSSACGGDSAMVSAELGDLPPNGLATVKVVVMPKTGTQVTAMAMAQAAEGDPNANNNLAESIVALSGPELVGRWVYCRQTRRGAGMRLRCSIDGRFAVRNTGDRNASVGFLRFYLSADNKYDASDLAIVDSTFGKLKAGASATFRVRKTYPLQFDTSGKYMIAVIDDGNNVLEKDETNNVHVFGPLP